MIAHPERTRRPKRSRRAAKLEFLERRDFLNGASTVETGAIGPETGVSAFAVADPGSTIVTPYDTIPNFAHADFAEGRNIVESTAGGNWSTLFGGVTRDDVLIIRNHVVFDMPLAEVYTLALYPGAHLEFRTDASTQLNAVNILVAEGAHLQVGSAAAPVQDQFKAQIVIRNEAFNTTLDPDQWGHGLIALGKVTMHGAARTSGASGALLATEPRAGDTTLLLETAPIGWKAGDKVVIPDTKAVTQGTILNAFPFNEEFMTIASISGNQITLTAPLQYDHFGARDADGTVRFRPHLAHTSRNVVVKSESAAGTRGHVLFTRRADVDIRYTSFGGLGRTTTAAIDNTTYDTNGNVTHVGTNQAGRYPAHFSHLIGPIAAPANGYQFTFVGNSVFCPMATHQFKWGTVLSDSHYGLVSDNTMYNWAGAGLVTETGTESYNVIDRNLSFTASGPAIPDDFLQDFGDVEGNHGAGYWFRGANNYIRDNIAANGRRYGFVMEAKDLKIPSPIPLFQGADTSISGQFQLVRLDRINPLDFRNNEAYATMIGFSFYGVQGNNYHVYDLKVWSPARAGLYTYYAVAGPVRMHNIVVRGNGQLSTSTQPAGVAHDIYSQVNIDGFDIQGLRRGIQLIGWQSALVQNGLLINADNITQQYGAPTNHVGTTTTIRNVRFGAMPGWSLTSIDMLVQTNLQDLFGRNRIFVEDYDQVAGDDFEVYYNEQAPDWIIPSTATAAPQTGITNAQSWALYQVAVADAVAPVGAVTRPGINGLVRITSTPANTPPTLNQVGDQTVDEDQLLSISVTASDVNGDPLTFTAQGLPPGATFDPNSQAFSWHPDYFQSGTYNVTFSVSDGTDTVTEQIVITVNNVLSNGQPLAADDRYKLSSASGSFVASTSVLANDLDPDGRPIVAQLAQGPQYGNLMFNSDGTFTYTPSGTGRGVDWFSYTASNGSSQSNEAKVFLYSHKGALVRKLFLQVLGREPDSGGWEYWADRVEQGTASLGNIASGIFESNERLDPIIRQMYRDYLFRDADQAGLDHWRENVWKRDGSPDNVVAGIISSPEFYLSAGGTDTAWVTELYRRLLHREPDAAGLTYWTNMLQGVGISRTSAVVGMSRAAVVLGFVRSEENYHSLVQGWYMQYLSRLPDAAAESSLVDQLLAGWSQRDVQMQLLDSSEYASVAD